MSLTPRHGTRGQRIAAKADLLGDCARMYAHGAAPLSDLLTAAIEYADAVGEPPRKEDAR